MILTIPQRLSHVTTAAMLHTGADPGFYKGGCPGTLYTPWIRPWDMNAVKHGA